MSDRARITPVDVVFIGVSLGLLVFLFEPVYQLLGDSNLGAGTELLFRMTLPGLAAMLLFVTYRVSLLGSGGAS